MIQLFNRRNWKVGGSAFADEDATPLERLRALFVAAGKVLEAPRPLFVSFVEAIAQAGRSEDVRQQLAAHYRDARRATAEAIRAMFGPAAERLDGEPEGMAVLLLALFDGLVLQWLLEPDAVPSGEEQITALIGTMALALAVDSPSADNRRARQRRVVRA